MRLVRWLMPLALSLLAACAWWMAGRPGIADLDRLIFGHAVHADNDIECDACHSGVAAAEDTSASYLPKEEACLECHEREGNCDMCHTNAKKAKPRPPHGSALGFSHAKHDASRVGEAGCATCHRGAIASTALPAGRPTMDICLACHNHAEDYAQARCNHCHPSLRTAPLRAVAEHDHAGDWISRHGAMARVTGASCLECHPQSACADCHSRVPAAARVRLYPERVGESQIHRGDWLTSHPIEARADGDTCLRCHLGNNDCRDCHTASGVTAASDLAWPPHPPGYALRGAAQFHGDDARLRIETCAACHDQGPASVCITCHRVGGVGGNPHPTGWQGRYGSAAVADNPVCLYCHPP